MEVNNYANSTGKQYTGALSFDVMRPSTVDVNIPITEGKNVNGELLGLILQEIATPLAERLEAAKRPNHNPLEENMAIYNNDNGMSINNHNSQIGGLGANITCIPEHKLIAMWANEIHMCGNVKLIPNQPHRALDLNFGPFNMAFAPPVEETPRPTPRLAVLAIDTEDVGYSNIPTPKTEDTMYDVSILDVVYSAEQSTKRQLTRHLEEFDSTKIGANTLKNSKFSEQKSISAEMSATENPPIYVVIPDHVHTDPISGVTGPVSEWIGPKNCAAAVRGVKYEYLFGYNRLSDIITNKQVTLEKETKL